MEVRRWRRAARRLLALSFVWAPLLVAGPAVAEWKPKPPPTTAPAPEALQEARDRYEKGVALYEVEGDVEGALVELQRAYEIAPSYKVLYNVGQVARTARDYATSLRAFEGYLEYGGDELPPKRKKAVEDELEALRGLVANLDIVTNIKGATITVDDDEVGRSPLTDAVLVNAGKRRIGASFEGRTTNKVVTVAGRDRKLVELLFPEEDGVTGAVGPTPPGGDPVSPPVPGGDTPPPTDDGGVNPFVLVGWIATGALASAAVVTGIVTLGEDAELDDATYVGSTPPAEIEDQKSTVDTLGLVTDILAVSATVALGVTLYFTLTDDDAPADVSVGAGPRGVVVRGTFE